MGTLKKKELKKIWNFLKPTIDAKNLKWLKKNREHAWKDWPKGDYKGVWEKIHTEQRIHLCLIIQDILHAKSNGQAGFYSFDLTKKNFLVLADILNLEIPENMTKPALSEMVLSKIEGFE